MTEDERANDDEKKELFFKLSVILTGVKTARNEILSSAFDPSEAIYLMDDVIEQLKALMYH